MSILKLKIARAREADKRIRKELRSEKMKQAHLELQQSVDIESTQVKTPRQRQPPTEVIARNLEAIPRGLTSAKNIVKNYSRALTNFAISIQAAPYLENFLSLYQVEEKFFRNFIEAKKDKVNCIKGLRELLLAEEEDDRQLAGAKNVFRELSIIFLKIFSVNWIFHSKVGDKLTHLKYRFKILRRIQNPALFTYLEEFTKSS